MGRITCDKFVRTMIWFSDVVHKGYESLKLKCPKLEN